MSSPIPLDCIIQGDALEVLRTLPGESAQTIVTSPPYWRQRDYGVDGQIGLERTPEEFIDRLLTVFGEAHRVLRSDGTMWLNIGDTYSSGGKGGGGSKMRDRGKSAWERRGNMVGWNSPPPGYQRKEIIGIPWMLAFALRSVGWMLRQDLIWSKPNALPESALDRCVKSHEYLFLLTKNPKYYWSRESMREQASGAGRRRNDRFGGKKHTADTTRQSEGTIYTGSEFRNRRSVWTISTSPFSDGHYATFPRELARRCILAGSRPGDLVLDPFGGAGTTAVEARNLGRKYLLIELDPRSIEIAERRIHRECAQLTLISQCGGGNGSVED